jgi:hypothetical protein
MWKWVIALNMDHRRIVQAVDKWVEEQSTTSLNEIFQNEIHGMSEIFPQLNTTLDFPLSWFFSRHQKLKFKA